MAAPHKPLTRCHMTGNFHSCLWSFCDDRFCHQRMCPCHAGRLLTHLVQLVNTHDCVNATVTGSLRNSSCANDICSYSAPLIHAEFDIYAAFQKSRPISGELLRTLCAGRSPRQKTRDKRAICEMTSVFSCSIADGVKTNKSIYKVVTHSVSVVNTVTSQTI